MATNVGELSVKLGFDVDEKTLNSFNKNIKDLSSNMLGLVGISSLTAAGVGAFARGAYDNAQSIKNLASQTNISADALQRYGSIAAALNPSIDTSTAIKSLVDLDKAWNLYRTTGQGSINFNAAARLGVGVGNLTSLQYVQALHQKYKGLTDPKAIQSLSQNLQQLNLPPEFVTAIIASDDRIKDISDKTALTAKELDEMAKSSERIATAWGSIGHSFSMMVNNGFMATATENIASVLGRSVKDPKSFLLNPWGDNIKNWLNPKKSNSTSGGISAIPATSGASGVAAQYAAAGYSPLAIAAIMGNIQQESGGNASAVNPTSGAYGLYQYLGDRKRKLFAKYGKNPTASEQTQFAIDELNGGGQYGRVGKYLKEGHTFRQNTDEFFRLFEGPGDASLGKRVGFGQQYAAANNIKIEMNIQSNNPHEIAEELNHQIKQTLSQTNNGDNH